MIKVKCKYCDYELEKPRWEHIIYAVRKDGGCIRYNICPRASEKGWRLIGVKRLLFHAVKRNDVDGKGLCYKVL